MAVTGSISPPGNPEWTRQRIAVFADDLTGAIEVGVLARAGGLCTRVLLGPEAAAPASRVTVYDTGTRDLPPTVAAAILRHAASCWRDDPNTVILKKTDSLLRGNIATEFAALRHAYPRRTIVFVPAYPLMGRRVSGGVLHLRDASGEWKPETSVTALLEEAFSPAEIRRAASVEDLEAAVQTRGVSVVVCDGATQQEVDAIGAWLREQASRWIVAGPAGVFRSFFTPQEPEPLAPFPERIPTGVGFVGSQHPVTLAQLEALAVSGRAMVHQAESTSLSEYLPLLEQARSAGQWLFLHAPAARLPEMHLHPIPAAVYLSGGATASASLLRSGIHELEPASELMPGIVLSHADQDGRRIPVITKSGAFGDPDTLVRVLVLLQGETIGR